MLDSAHRILDYTKNMRFEQFIHDSKTVDAVIRNFEIMGEATNRLLEEFRITNHSIEWMKIRGFRNRIVPD